LKLNRMRENMEGENKFELECFCFKLMDLCWILIVRCEYATVLKAWKNLKAILVIGLGDPWDCETSRLPHFLVKELTGGDISLTRLPPFTSQENPWYAFLLLAESTPGP
jgi:hypothetical protein